VSRIDLTVSVLQAHTVGVLAIHASVTPSRAVAAKANTVTAVNGVTFLTAPHALPWVTGALLRDSVADGSADLLDPRSGE